MRLTSQVADGWFQAGLAGSILFNPDQQSSPIAVATGFAILLLPYSVMGPYVGVLLDRWDRRTSLATANLLRALMVLPAAILLWSGAQNVFFAASALIVIAINRFFLAGISAALPRVVDDDKLVPANALATTLGTICFSTGLFSAAALIAVDAVGVNSRGYGVIAVAGALGYLVSGLLCRGLFRHGALGPLAHERRAGRLLRALYEVARGMVEGARHLSERRRAARVIALHAVYRGLFGVLTLAVLLLYSKYFGQEQGRTAQSLQDLGLIAVAGAAGAGLAAIITPYGVRRLGATRWLVSIVAGVGVVVLACGLPFQKTLLLVAAFLINVASQSVKIIVDATIQHECEDIYRGRIFSVNDTAFNLCFVGGLFITAATFPGNGKSVAGLITVSAVFLLLALWFGVASSRHREPAEATA